MEIGQADGYSIKKHKFKRWIYANKLTQPKVAKRIGISGEELKRKLRLKEKFDEQQIRKLVYLMGAEAAFKVMYFPDAEFRLKVFKQVFEFEKECSHDGKLKG